MNRELLQQLPFALRSAVEQEWQRLQTEIDRLVLVGKCRDEQMRLLLLEKYGAKNEQLRFFTEVGVQQQGISERVLK